MNESSVWLDLDQITAGLRVVTSEQLRLKLEEVKPESRRIEDLNCDSLDLVELIMETEDEFGITTPETPATSVGKLIFTRQPFRIRDLAEFAFLNQGTGNTLPSEHSTKRKVSTREFTSAARYASWKACRCQWCSKRMDHRDLA